MDNAQKYQGTLQRLCEKAAQATRVRSRGGNGYKTSSISFKKKKKWSVHLIHKDWDPASPTNTELSLQNIDNFAPHNSGGGTGKKMRSMF